MIPLTQLLGIGCFAMLLYIAAETILRELNLWRRRT